MQIVVNQSLPALQQQFDRLRARLGGDLTPLMSAIGGVLESSTRERFESKRDPAGISWEQLKPSTLRAKRTAEGRAYGGILIKEEVMVDSITSHATSQSVAVGVTPHYGVYHQLGTKHIPARPFLGLSVENESNILRKVQEFIDGVFA